MNDDLTREAIIAAADNGTITPAQINALMNEAAGEIQKLLASSETDRAEIQRLTAERDGWGATMMEYVADRAENHRLRDQRDTAWAQGFRSGWSISGEGYNGEYPDEGIEWDKSAGYKAMVRVISDRDKP